MNHLDTNWVEHGYGTRFQGFQNLMRQRIRDILIVSSLYDLYLFEEDGRLYELIRNEYLSLQLSHAPELTRVSKGYEAITLLKERVFDMVIITLHTEDIPPVKLASLIKELDIKFAGLDIRIPVVLLAFDNRELADLLRHSDVSVFDKIFIWQGDFRLIIGIIKYFEDKLNIDHDTKIVGVQSIILIEDNIRDYSSFLPIIYTEIIQQSQRLVGEGINLSHKFLRMRARPKILMSQTYEEAWEYFTNYKEHILGIISDIDFPRNGKHQEKAGLELTAEIRKHHSDIPVLLQSSDGSYENAAHLVGASFLRKGSSTLLHDLRNFMKQYFSFGDFIFRLPDGTEIARATDLKSMEQTLKIVPVDSIQFHAERNHFSNWFKARTEFWLAHQLRPKKVSDFKSVDDLRSHIITSLRYYRKMRQRGLIADFQKESFDPNNSFARIGGGSLGGKARGLGFLNILLNNYQIRSQFDGIEISVPPAIVIGTDIFDQFLEENDLRGFALECENDSEIKKRFLEASVFPEEAVGQLIAFLDLVRTPLAVRSSSLLEDSQYHPFAGVYSTIMIPNNDHDPFKRLSELVSSIKLIYASTFFSNAKNYIKVTSYRHEEEKMAVIIQKMVGTQFNGRFYPTFSGVAKSYNFYPLPPQKTEDGIVSVALGLGKMVVEGGETVRFSPKHPGRLIQFHSVDAALKSSQQDFYALSLLQNKDDESNTDESGTKLYPLDTAEQDGTLHFVASTYSFENHSIYDGISRVGARLVTFAPILKNRIFPLANILELLLDMGSWGMGAEVEIEFAVNLNTKRGEPVDFGVLQMRPIVVSHETEKMNLEKYENTALVARSNEVMGNGVINEISDIVFIDPEHFDRAKTRDTATIINLMNSKLVKEGRPYLLIGPGRWGSLDQWLGIPVVWSQISGAKAIIECQFKDLKVTPSQGSHFFQNLTSFSVAYFTITENDKNCHIDYNWIRNLPFEDENNFVKLIRLEKPLIIKMNAGQKMGIIIKPSEEVEDE